MSEQSEFPRRHGLPGGFSDGLAQDQAQHAQWKRFEEPTPQTSGVDLVPGQLYEFWPGGSIFNEHGTYLGQFHLADAPRPCADDEHDWQWTRVGPPDAPAFERCRKCLTERGRSS